MEGVTLWRGSHEVSALWIDAGLADAPERVLALWRPGVAVSWVEGGWLVRLDRPRRMDVGTAPGLALVDRGGALLGADTRADRGELVLPRHGRLIRVAIASLTSVDVSSWLALDPLTLPPVRSLAPPPVAPVAATIPSARAVLGRPALDGEAEQVAAALTTPAATGEPPWWGPMAVAAVGWLRRAASALPFGRASGAARATGTADGPPPAPKPPNALERWLDRVSARLLGSFMAGRHGRYLADLVDMFEGGDLDKALRHAIPLSGEPAPDARPAFGVPAPRADLSLRPGRRVTSVVAFREDAVSGLRGLYERAAERLLRDGKVHDAAFVYAELLKDHERAIALLEKHGEYKVAAELAEGADRPAHQRMRLWIRAGRMDRAVAIARQTGVFTVVVSTLEGTDPQLARALRLAWAEHLASIGDFAQATRVAWTDPTLRPLAVPWLDAALTESAPAGAALVALLLRQTPETFEMAKERVDALLTGTSAGRVRLRMALVDGLFADGGEHGARLARPVVRALLQDRHRFPAAVPSAWLLKLSGQLGSQLREPALAHDLPSFVVDGPDLLKRVDTVLVHVARGDVGVAPVSDVAWADDGALLVALGQLGVRAYDSGGRERARFDVPATQLVVQRQSTRALALERRSFGVTVTRLDLQRRAASPWHDAPYQAVAREAHHGTWMVSTRDALIALDLATDVPTASWRLNDVGPVLALVAAGGHFCAVVGDERWSFSSHPIQLRRREALLDRTADWPVASALGPNGHQVRVTLVAASTEPAMMEASGAAALQFETTDPRHPLIQGAWVEVPGLMLGECTSMGVEVGDDWVAVTLRGADRGVVVVSPRANPRAALVVSLAGATNVVARLAQLGNPSRPADTVVIGDDCGRALAFDLTTGSCVRDVRVV